LWARENTAVIRYQGKSYRTTGIRNNLRPGRLRKGEPTMIGGMHTIVYSNQADAVRAFFRDVLEFPSVDAGHGWLIFATPPSELAVHPAGGRGHNELYLLCADIKAEVTRLEAKGVEFPEPITEQRWGRVTKLRLPDGETMGLYQPAHPTAIRMRGAARPALSKKKRSRARSAKAHKRKRS
jgi:hypothetical protein